MQKRKYKENRLTLAGMNCAGLSSKWQYFNKLINDKSPRAFFLQETKLNKKTKNQH